MKPVEIRPHERLALLQTVLMLRALSGQPQFKGTYGITLQVWAQAIEDITTRMEEDDATAP